jgi:hypothetical protein
MQGKGDILFRVSQAAFGGAVIMCCEQAL